MFCKYLVLLLLVLLQEVYLVSNKYTLMDQLSSRSDVAIKELTTHEYSSFEQITHTLMTFITERPTVFNIEKNSTLPPINVSPSPESQIEFSQESNNNQQSTQLPVVMESKDNHKQLPTVMESKDYHKQFSTVMESKDNHKQFSTVMESKDYSSQLPTVMDSKDNHKQFSTVMESKNDHKQLPTVIESKDYSTQLPTVMDSKNDHKQFSTVVEYNDYFTQQDLKESRSSSYIHHVRSTILKEYGNERICFTNIFGHYVFNLPSMYYTGSKCIFITSL